MDTKDLLKQAKNSVEDIIKQITRKERMTPAELGYLTESVCLIEKINKIEENGNGEYDEGGSYSNTSRMSRNSYNSHNMMYDEPVYDDDMSYRRGRSSVTGRYVSRDGGSNDSSRGYYDSSGNYRSFEGGNSSRRYHDGNGYSGHSIQDRMIDKLERMYDEARTDHERRIVDEWINRLRG